MTLEQRLEKQDQQIRRLKKWMAGVAALALVAVVAGTVGVVRAANKTFDVVTAKEIRVEVLRIRRKGKKSTSIKLYDVRAGGRMRFYDEKGRLVGGYYIGGYTNHRR